MKDRRSPLLQVGRNCWRIERADRFAVLVDAEAYYQSLYEAMIMAQRRIVILGWDIDSRLLLTRKPAEQWPAKLGRLLDALATRREQLEIYILAWDFVPLYLFEREPLPRIKFGWSTHERVHFELDSCCPPGGSQHEKLVVIDDQIAFCGGLDLCDVRWDTPEHRDDDPQRVDVHGKPYEPHHDVQVMVDAEVAGSLGCVASDRWFTATGQRLDPLRLEGDAWPASVEPIMRDVEVAISRTRCAYDRFSDVREVESLWIDTIAGARQRLYIENPYFTSETVTEKLVERLKHPDCPEIVLIVPQPPTGWLEGVTLGVLRDRCMRRLREADRFGRLHVYCPFVPDRMGNPNAVPIHLHDKVCIVDDRLLRIGSSNITNRSMGLDNECDLAIESDHGETHAAIIEVRNRLLAEHLGCSPRDVQTSVERSGSLVQAIEQLRGGARSLLHYHDNGSALAHRVLPEAALVDPDRPISMERVGRAIRRDERLYKRLRAIGLAWWGVMLVVLVIGNVAGWIDAASLAQWLSEFATESVWGVLTVPIAFVIAGLFFVPVTLMIANCGALFGAWVGGVYALLGALSSAAVYFFLGRWVGMGTVQRIASLRLQRAMRAIASRGILAVAAIRVVPIAPHLVVGLAAGAARIRFRDYMLGTIVAMAPGTLVLTLLGQHFSHGMASPSPTAMVTMVVLIAVGLALAWLMQRWLGNPLRAGARPPPQPEGHDAERPDVGALAGRYRRRFASESSVE